MMDAYVVTLRWGDAVVEIRTYCGNVQEAWRQVIAAEHVPMSAVCDTWKVES